MAKWSHLQTLFRLLSVDKDDSDDEDGNQKLRFKCLLCVPKDNSIACDNTSQSNLRRHISRAHPSQVREYDRLCRGKRKSLSVDDPPSKQIKIDNYSGSGNSPLVSQKEIDQLVLRHIIDDCQPLTLVRSKSFRDIINRLAPKRSIMCYESLKDKLEDNFDIMKDKLKDAFSLAGSVSITVDGWSCATKAFIGMTVHWLDSELKRRSAALACRRIYGRHTYDVIASNIEDILIEFRIHNKTSGATTDNASNFVKAFRLFADKDEDEDLKNIDIEGELTFHEITDELFDDFEDATYHLPPHHRCAAHTLNLITTQDTKKAQESPALKKVAQSAFAICQMIWNKQSRSTCAADKIRDMFDCLFVIPVPTRWNSMYYALVKMRKMIKRSDDNLGALTDSLGIKKRFNEKEVAFISEYCDVMCPLATALNILECENHMYLGYLLPTIAAIEKQLRSLQDQLTYCTCLVQGILEGLEKRFSHYFSNKKFILASVTIPKFKTGWIVDEEKRLHAISLLQKEVDGLIEIELSSGSSDSDKESEEEFFQSMIYHHEIKSNVVNEYFASKSKEIESLKCHPLIEILFRRYNTTLPSSASVERLFSHAGGIFRKNRHSLHDSTFEMLLMMKLNKDLC